MQFYNNDKLMNSPIIHQWINQNSIKDNKILIIDEVDDTRSTLKYVVDNLKPYCKELAVGVIHNKTHNNKKPLGVPLKN